MSSLEIKPNIEDYKLANSVDWAEYAIALEEYCKVLETECKIIEDAITELDGFANYYLLKQGLSQEKIDKYVKDGADLIQKILAKKK